MLDPTLAAARAGYHRRTLAPSRVFRRSLVVGLIVMGIVVAVLWVLPSGSYIFLPDPALSADAVVHVPGEKPGREKGGIYFLEVHIRKASLLERLIPSIRKGASIVSANAYNPEKLSPGKLHEISREQMSTSQLLAIAVALQSLGYEVPATGAEVVAVREGYPAAGRVHLGDVIIAAGGIAVASPDELARAMDPVKPGQTVSLRLLRKGKPQELALRTRPAPGEPDRAIFGITVQPKLKFPLAIRINAGGIGGPSAGLAFALDVVDELDGDLDKGRKVAVTGALELDGTVDPIGGIKQKTFGARESGASVFIVPEENAAEARSYADGLTIVPVTSFRQALAYLRTS